MKFPNYTPIDLTTYPRKEHWNYYQNQLPVGFSLTVRMDVTHLVKLHSTYKFYPMVLYCISKTIHSLDCMRMMKDENGNPGIWETSNINFTIFHKDDHTFSDVWMEHKEDFKEFLEEYNTIVETYKDVKGIKARENQPMNFFCASNVPWIDFSGYTSHTIYPDALFPIITFGKYVKENDTYKMSLNMTINHSACDGYDAAIFFETLQQEMNTL